MASTVDAVGHGPETAPPGALGPSDAPSARPNLSGDLGAMLTTPPAFGRALHGYDRLQVDNYVAWAEGRLAAADRAIDDLITRCSRYRAQAQACRAQLRHSPEGQELIALSQRIGTMLALAADEASRITALAAAEADRTRAEARAEADARLRKAEAINGAAAASAGRLLDEARRERNEAVGCRERAAQEAERMLVQAAHEREHLDAEAARARELLDREAEERRELAAAAAAERMRRTEEEFRRQQETTAAAAARALAASRAEIEQLERRRARADEGLGRMRDHVRQALATLAADPPDPPAEREPAAPVTEQRVAS